MDLANRKVAVVGLGESGRAAARLCLSRGAEVEGCDEIMDPNELAPAVAALQAAGMRIKTGPLSFEDSDLVVVSPGVPRRSAIDDAEARGIEVIGELELASRFLDAPLALVGGTNGKSTVTALLGEMLARAGKRVFVGGNFGAPLCEAVGGNHEVLVVEISSFQAERVPTLHARLHALLNVTEDHLDRYTSFEDYASAKGNPFANMTADDWAVVPAGDATCAAQAARGAATIRDFGIEGGEVSVDDDAIVDRRYGWRFPLAEVALRGRHNRSNACASIAAAAIMGASGEAMAAALATFRGLPHRHALVAERGGVRFYDDSKATNVGAAVAALRGLDEQRAVLIAGGRDKLGSYAPLARALADKGRALVVLGEAAERIAEAAEGKVPVSFAQSMPEAVREASRLACAGDAVLLSPACASFDMFKSYAARGDAFAEAVRALDEGKSG